MNKEFKEINWDVNVALSNFNETVKLIFDKHAPYAEKKVKGKSCPWMYHNLRKAMIDRNRMLRKARKTKSTDYWNIYKRLLNICSNKLKSAKSSFQRGLLEENSADPRKFWKVIKEILPFQNKAVANVGNMTKEALQNQTNVFSMYFSTAVNLLKEKSIWLMDFIWRCLKRLTPRTSVIFKLQNVSTAFVLKELKQLK